MYSDIEAFNLIANFHFFWFVEAEQLMKSAKVLKKHAETNGKDYFGTYQMLRAMAFECYLKAIISLETRSVAFNGTIQKEYQTHKLELLAKKIRSINFSELDHQMLDTLTHWIFLGRYPLAKSANGIFYDADIPWSDNLEKNIENLLDRLRGRCVCNPPPIIELL